MEKKQGFEQVLAALIGLLTVAGQLRPLIQDFNISRALLVLVSASPVVQGIVQNSGQLWQQFIDLDPNETGEISAELQAKFPSPDKFQKDVLGFVANAASTHGFIFATIEAGKIEIENWKDWGESLGKQEAA